MTKAYIQGSFYLKKTPDTDGNTTAVAENEPYYDHNYDSVGKLYQLIFNEKGLFLRTRGEFGEYDNKLNPVQEQTLENDYIDFMKWLHETKYIGRMGKRIKPMNGDESYTWPVLVLYQSPTHTIIYDPLKEGEAAVPISILDERFSSSSDWEFEGEVNTLYKEPAIFYKALFKESFQKKENNGLWFK